VLEEDPKSTVVTSTTVLICAVEVVGLASKVEEMTELGGIVGVADAMVGITELSGATAVFGREAVSIALEVPGVVTELGEEEVAPSGDSVLVVMGMVELLLRVDSDGIGTVVDIKVMSGELRVLESILESVAISIDMELVGTNVEWDELGEEAVASAVDDEEGGTVEEVVLSVDTVVLEAEPEAIILTIDDRVLETDNGATVLSFDTDTLDREEVKLRVDEDVIVLGIESGVERTELEELALNAGVLEKEVGVTLPSFDDEVVRREVDSVAVSKEGEVLILSVDFEVDEKMVVVILISVGSA
jgi:hypothetical protein